MDLAYLEVGTYIYVLTLCQVREKNNHNKNESDLFFLYNSAS